MNTRLQTINIEFKAKIDDRHIAEKLLLPLNPDFIGEDHQTDTYFNIQDGRLKLREGNIENALIYYNRADSADAKQCNVILYQHTPDEALKQILKTVHGIKVQVVKKRLIYFIENVKLHFDEVEGLGNFIEVEAIDRDGSVGIEKLKAQANYYLRYFDIKPDQLVSQSYSDLLLEQVKI